MVHQAWTSCATLAHLFFFPKINIAASENRHGRCNSKSSEVHLYLWDCRGNSSGACVLCLSMWSKQTGSVLKFRNFLKMYHKLPSGQYNFESPSVTWFKTHQMSILGGWAMSDHEVPLSCNARVHHMDLHAFQGFQSVKVKVTKLTRFLYLVSSV